MHKKKNQQSGLPHEEKGTEAGAWKGNIVKVLFSRIVLKDDRWKGSTVP